MDVVTWMDFGESLSFLGFSAFGAHKPQPTKRRNYSEALYVK